MLKGCADKHGVITPVDYRENPKAPSTYIDFQGRVYLINVADRKYYPDHDVEVGNEGF